MMIDEPEIKEKGMFEHRPLSIFIWAVLPIITVFGASFGAIGVQNEVTSNNLSIFILSITQFFSIAILFVLPALFLSFLYKKDIFSFLNLRKLPSLKIIAFALAIILVSNTFLNLLTDLNALIPLPEVLAKKFTIMHESALSTQAQFLNFKGLGEFILVFFIMAILPAIAEEIYFRGLLEGVLFDLKMAPVHAIIISSFLFAIIHLEFYYLLPLFFMGLTLGYIYYRTKNLWLAIITHFFNNALIVVISATNKVSLTSIDLEGSPSIYVSITGMFIFAALIYFFHKQTINSKF